MPTVKHISRISRLKETISNDFSEVRNLKLIRYGARSPKNKPSENDFKKVVFDLNAGKPKIVFPWFWNHDDVKTFKEKYSPAIDQDKFYKLLTEILSIVNISKSHWIERVNLFHLFGVSKFFEAPSNKILKLQDEYLNKHSYGLISVSALTAKFLSKEPESKDISLILDKIEMNQIIKAYAEYQLYYYGGFDSLILTLEQYIDTTKEIMIPLSLFSIQMAFNQNKSHTSIIHDRLINKLPNATKNLLVKKLKTID